MQLKDLGSEFALIERLARRGESRPDLVVGNGDDAAVVRCGGELLAISTDYYVENRHFRFDFSTPAQVGWKAIEASASDIVAMGGKPQHAVVCLGAPAEAEVKCIEEIYAGMYSSCERLGIALLGGDTVCAPGTVSLAVTVTGLIKNEAQICRRSTARPGDLIFVTGPLGNAGAGLELLLRGAAGHEFLKRCHQAPRCRIDLVEQLAPLASSAIDISDGLASELHHISRESGAACVVQPGRIPLSPELRKACEKLGRDPLEFAYGGGEDFELLFTTSASNRGRVPGVEIGVVEAGNGVWLEDAGGRRALANRGFDHLRS